MESTRPTPPLAPSPASSSARPLRRRWPFLVKLLLVLVVLVAVSLISSFIQHRSMVNNAHRRVAIVRLTGAIENIDAIGPWLDEIHADPYIAAVLLRIDSPGGAVTASQELYDKVRRIAEFKPVVVSMGDVAASGGYYVALGASAIVANASTITGSIGVKMVLPNFSELMDKIGISEVALTSGVMKDAGSPFRDLSKEERAYFESIVMDLYDQFVADVSASRGLPVDYVENLADGRAYTGRQALDLGLVDFLGSINDAIDILCDITGIDEPLYVEQPEPEASLLDMLLTRLTGSARISLPPVLNSSSSGPVFMYLY